MPRFFVEGVEGDSAVIGGEDALHLIRSLRVRVGERMTVCDQRGSDYLCQVASLSGDAVLLRVLEQRPNDTEPAVRVTLYQALPKGDKLEFILQKAVELGAARIVPVESRYCTVRAESFDKKRARYERIILEAAKQCGRGIVPQLGDVLPFDAAVKEMSPNRALVFYEGGGRRVGELLQEGDREVSLLIGSEGGFSPEEIALCEALGVARATLGKRILRCETAPLAALTLVLHAAGEM